MEMSISTFVCATLGVLITWLVTYCTAEAKAFQVQCKGPRLIEARWFSTFKDNSTAEFRIILNERLDPKCKEPLNKFLCHCSMTDTLPNSNNQIQLAVCKLNEIDATQCERLLKEKSVLVPPEAPSSFSAVAVDNQSIEFAWDTPAQNMVGLQIGLWVWTSGAPIRFLVDASVGAQKRNLSGLSPLTEYNAALSIHNSNKNLEDICNQTIKVLTFPNAPMIKVSDVGSSWMRITFEPTLKADPFNLINTAVAMDAAGTRTSCSVSASIQNISCDIGSLRSDTEYSIIARACVGEHCSVDSPAITVTTLTEDVFDLRSEYDPPEVTLI
ncbi:hypothetical protein SprV_0802560900 [Sparganum proliferum]